MKLIGNPKEKEEGARTEEEKRELVCSRCPGFFMVSRFHTGRANRKGSSTANKTSEYQNSVKRNTSARMTGSGNSFSGMVS